MERLVCVLGKSCVGKDSIVTIASGDLQAPIAVSFTTRPMRNGETQGKEYNFITEEEFNELKESGEIAEYTTYNVADNKTWHYGLTKAELEKSRCVMVIVNPHGLEQLTEIYGDKVVSVLVECDGLDRLRRSIDRDMKSNPKELCRRFLADEYDFSSVKYDYVIYNENGIKNKAVLELKKILIEEMGK